MPRVPPNVKFEIDDAEQDWTWPEDHFDYVHLRTMAAAVRDWPRMFRQAYRYVYFHYLHLVTSLILSTATPNPAATSSSKNKTTWASSNPPPATPAPPS